MGVSVYVCVWAGAGAFLSLCSYHLSKYKFSLEINQSTLHMQDVVFWFSNILIAPPHVLLEHNGRKIVNYELNCFERK